MTPVDTLCQWFWTAMIFGSIAWYVTLLFFVGVLGGCEIVQMTKDLSKPIPEKAEDADQRS